MNKKKIGEFILSLRKEKGLTQDELAIKLAVDRATISKWERGVYIPNVEMLPKLRDLFGVTINEILCGERKTKENAHEIDNVTMNILLDNAKKKMSRNLLYILITVISVLLLFLFCYFINHYNSIYVYKIDGENDGFEIRDGIMVFTNEISFIKLGKIKTSNQEEIKKTRLYFKKKEEERLIISTDDENTTSLIMNWFKASNHFYYNDIFYIKDGLYLEITLANGKSTVIPLKLSKQYSNSRLLDKKARVESLKDYIDKVNDTIPKYILDNFKFKDDAYERMGVEENVIKEWYSPEIPIYILYRKYGDGESTLEYFPKDNYIDYYTIVGEDYSGNFIYNYDTENCDIGKCNMSIVEEFREKYLNKLKIEKGEISP